MTRRRLTVAPREWLLAAPFATATTADDRVTLVEVVLEEGGCTGHGEAAGVYFRGEGAAAVVAAVESVRRPIEDGIDRMALQSLLPAGGARNALDCALWDLEAQLTGVAVTARTGLASRPVTTACSIGIGTPEAMAARARALGEFPVLKLKLDRTAPLERVAAVREARPDARLIADANGSWRIADLEEWERPLRDLGLEMLEQPCSPHDDAALAGLDLSLRLCADESCLTRDDLDRVAPAFDLICVKLDKTGGLTEALALVAEARARGLDYIVGNMLGTALAMAPLSLLAGAAHYADMDGPLLLASDREPGMVMRGAAVQPLVPAVWGGRR